MLCPFCQEEIADGALKCKHCGSMLAQQQPPQQSAPIPQQQYAPSPQQQYASQPQQQFSSVAATPEGTWLWPGLSLGLSILSLVLVWLGFLAFIIAAAALVLGIIGLRKQPLGRGMSITGIVISSVAAIFSIFWALFWTAAVLSS
jgi:hypothetical protein